MSMVVTCECGEVVRAADDGELVAQVEARDDILGMAEEE